MSLGSKIRTLYNKHPIISNMVMYGTLYSASDVSQQTIRQKPKYDWAGTGRIATVGATFFGPFYYVWYGFLDKMLPGTAGRTIVKKIIVDQSIAGVIGVTAFFGGLAILERSKNVFEDTKSKAPKAFFGGCIYWPIAQGINFYFLPSHLRTAYVAVAAFVWTNVLCFLKSNKVEKTD